MIHCSKGLMVIIDGEAVVRCGSEARKDWYRPVKVACYHHRNQELLAFSSSLTAAPLNSCLFFVHS